MKRDPDKFTTIRGLPTKAANEAPELRTDLVWVDHPDTVLFMCWTLVKGATVESGVILGRFDLETHLACMHAAKRCWDIARHVAQRNGGAGRIAVPISSEESLDDTLATVDYIADRATGITRSTN